MRKIELAAAVLAAVTGLLAAPVAANAASARPAESVYTLSSMTRAFSALEPCPGDSNVYCTDSGDVHFQVYSTDSAWQMDQRQVSCKGQGYDGLPSAADGPVDITWCGVGGERHGRAERRGELERPSLDRRRAVRAHGPSRGPRRLHDMGQQFKYRLHRFLGYLGTLLRAASLTAVCVSLLIPRRHRVEGTGQARLTGQATQPPWPSSEPDGQVPDADEGTRAALPAYGEGGFIYLSGRFGYMPGTKQQPRRCRHHRAAAQGGGVPEAAQRLCDSGGGGLIAVTIVAFLLASLLGGKGSTKPAPADGARPQPAKGTYLLPAHAVSQVEAVPAARWPAMRRRNWAAARSARRRNCHPGLRGSARAATRRSCSSAPSTGPSARQNAGRS